MKPGPTKKFDRDEVLERAMQLFWEQGYEATGMTELIGHMGIGRQSLYDTFGDKRSLYIETLAHYFRTRVGPIMAQLRAPGSPLENVRQVFRMWEKMAEEGHCTGCMVGNSTAEMGYNDTEIQEKLAGYLRALEGAFHDTFVRAEAQGELPRGQSPRDLARHLVNTIQGVALLSKVLRDPGMAKSVIRSSLAMLQAG